MTTRRQQRGQVLLLAAICMVGLVGSLALAIDVGLLFHDKRNLQITADAAAVAAALDYKFNQSITSATNAAYGAALANGVDHTIAGNVVTVSTPPADGPNAGTPAGSFIEVKVTTATNPTFFMGLMTNSTTATVAARAVAGVGSPNGCLWALGKSGVDIPISGSASINMAGCEVFDNSDSANALTLSGSASLSAKEIGIVGGYTTSGAASVSPKPVTGIAPVADPLAALAAPNVSTAGCGAAQSFTSGGTLGPGCYNGLTISNSGTVTLSSGNYTINGNLSVSGAAQLVLGSGLYAITGNLSVSGSGTMSGTAVTFYTEGSVAVSGASSLTLTAPTTGAESGLLFFQSRTDSQSISITGSGAMNMQGIIYASDSALKMSGGTSGAIYTALIVDSVDFSGSATLQSYATVNSASVLAKTGLVE